MADTSRRPPWLKVPLPGPGRYPEVRRRLSALQVHTVCEQAHCPNTAECWGSGTATFLILGEICTRSCGFCAVTRGRPPAPPEESEPERVARAVRELDLRYAVITSVDRDDLPDGGAGAFARTVQAVLAQAPGVTVEVLTPDFGGDGQALTQVAGCGARVLGHNIEVPRRLTSLVRDRRCDFDRSLQVLRTYRALAPRALTKSSLLLGLGETEGEVREALRDLRAAGVDWVTMGQYLRPTARHLPVQRYVLPEEFEALAGLARQMGFPLVTAGPLVRSSYHAGEQEVQALLQRAGTDC